MPTKTPARSQGTKKKATAKSPARNGAKNGARAKTNRAVAMLMEDHRKVQKLFKDFEKADDDRKREIAQMVCAELKVHATLEEEIVYPAVRNEVADEDMDKVVDEADVEHQVAKDLIAKLENDKGGNHFEATFKVLSEYVGHHIEEEESEMFPEFNKADVDFDQLAEEMAERKVELRETNGLEVQTAKGSGRAGAEREPRSVGVKARR